MRKKISLPPKLIPVFTQPRGAVRYRGARGGRGSGKSFSFAKMALVFGAIERLRILCAREIQASIEESFYAELKNAIDSDPWLASEYDILKNRIINRLTGTEFFFKGLRHNISSIKSMAQIDICIIEEAEDVPEQSWIDLEPTIRAEKSEIWAIWNPRKEGSPVDTRLVKNADDSMVVAELQWWDNPFFTDRLNMQRERDRKVLDSATYEHIWEGQYLVRSKAQILHDKIKVEEFVGNPFWAGPYYGLDFGFSQDPTAGNMMWVDEEANRLYIEYDFAKVGLELDDTAEYTTKKLPGSDRHTVRADSARPESISYLKRNGLPKITGVAKGKGSVEDGISYLRSFSEIVIHPRCGDTIREARLYSYKTDRLTGDVLPDIVDANNHNIDAVRYGLEPLIKKRGAPGIRQL